MSIGGGTDETMLSIICKYMETLPSKWCSSTLPWKLSKQEHGLYCTLKVTASMCFKGKTSRKHNSNFANKLLIRVLDHYHSTCSPVSNFCWCGAVWKHVASCNFFFLFFSGLLFGGGLVSHTKHPEKMFSLIKVYLCFRASKPPIKKHNFHTDIAMISLVA